MAGKSSKRTSSRMKKGSVNWNIGLLVWTTGHSILGSDRIRYSKGILYFEHTRWRNGRWDFDRAKNTRKFKQKNYLKKNGEITQVEITDLLNSPSGQNLLCISDIGHHLLESILVALQLSSKYCDENPEKQALWSSYNCMKWRAFYLLASKLLVKSFSI